MLRTNPQPLTRTRPEAGPPGGSSCCPGAQATANSIQVSGAPGGFIQTSGLSTA